MEINLDGLIQLAQEFWEAPQSDIIRGAALVFRAALVVVFAVLLSGWVDRWLRGRLRDRKADATLSTMYRKVISTAIFVLAASWILGIFGASWSALVTLVGASTVVVAFSVQDLLRNYVAGYYMLVEQPIRVGDDIRVKGVEGVVSSMAIRTTHLVTTEGELVIIPNAVLFQEMVFNYSRAETDVTVVTISRLTLPLPEIGPALSEALAPLSTAMSQPPEIRLVSVTAGGAEAKVSIHRSPGNNHLTEIMTLLHTRFPDAELHDVTVLAE